MIAIWPSYLLRYGAFSVRIPKLLPVYTRAFRLLSRFVRGAIQDGSVSESRCFWSPSLEESEPHFDLHLIDSMPMKVANAATENRFK